MAVAYAYDPAVAPFHFGLIFALCLIVAGTGLLWNSHSDLTAGFRDNVRQFNWECTCFYLIWFFAVMAVVIGRHIFAAVAAGIALFLILHNTNNVLSMATINACRASNQGSGTFREYTAGGILAYAGMFLSLIVSFTPYTVGRANGPVVAVFDYLLGLVAFVLVLVGVIVLWCSHSAYTPYPTDLILAPGYNNNGVALYTETIDITMIAIMALFFTLSGVVAENVALRAFGAFVSAYAFNMIFHNMFNILYDNHAMVYAGCILCWLGMLVNIAIATMFFWGYGLP